MRPVDKWPVEARIQNNGHTIEINSDYKPYREAKPLLALNLGQFCSYCEEAYHQLRDLHVEHIQPKKYMEDGRYIYAHLETKWDNFLLSCETCNGQDNKDTKNVVYGKCHLPHLNNTFLSLCYMDGGVVVVNPDLEGTAKENASNLLNLVGLNKSPKESSPGDSRWKKRRKDWNLASLYLTKYREGKCDVRTIIDLVKGYGGWSIWFTIFRDHREVREALVEQFPGTSKECFDADYNPIPRHPGNQDDPI